MNRSLKFICFILFLQISISCTKEYIDAAPQLKIIVKDVNQNLVQDADIVLYKTEADFFSNTDSLRTGKTDSTGSCLFTDLEEKTYYFHVTCGEASNLWSTNYVDSLAAGKRYIVTTSIY